MPLPNHMRQLQLEATCAVSSGKSCSSVSVRADLLMDLLDTYEHCREQPAFAAFREQLRLRRAAERTLADLRMGTASVCVERALELGDIRKGTVRS